MINITESINGMLGEPDADRRMNKYLMTNSHINIDNINMRSNLNGECSFLKLSGFNIFIIIIVIKQKIQPIYKDRLNHH